MNAPSATITRLASNLQHRLQDSLQCRDVTFHWTFEPPGSSCRLHMELGVSDSAQLETAERQLRDSLVLISQVWQEAASGKELRRSFRAVIPPDVMSESLPLDTPAESLFRITLHCPMTSVRCQTSESPEQRNCFGSGMSLVMKGGGIKGLAYVGALEVLEAVSKPS